jgi:hypothetical protein
MGESDLDLVDDRRSRSSFADVATSAHFSVSDFDDCSRQEAFAGFLTFARTHAEHARSGRLAFAGDGPVYGAGAGIGAKLAYISDDRTERYLAE